MSAWGPARGRWTAAAGAAVTALLALALVPLAGGAARAEGDVTIEALPQSLAVPSDGFGRLAVVVRNGTGGPVTHLRIVASAVGVAMTPAAGVPSRVAAGTSAVLPYRVRLRGARITPRQVLLRATYAAQGRQGSAAVALTVERYVPDPVDQLATVAVSSGLRTLDDVRGGDVYLVVRNATARPLTVRQVQTSAPHFVTMRRQGSPTCPAPPSGKPPPDPDELGCPVPPGGVLTIRYDVSAKNVDRTGNDVLLFAVTMAPAHGGRAFTLVATHDVTTGLFGESELSTLFQIPSLLLLPGFIALIWLAVLWRAGARPSELSGKDFAYQPATPTFWFLAVLGSIAVSVAYWLVTRHDVLRALTLHDALWLVGIALVIVTVTWVPVAGAMRWYANQRTPKAGQDALTVLERLGKADASTKLPLVRVDGATDLRLLAERGTALLVGPRIRYELTTADAALEGQINDALSKPTLATAAQRLKAASRAGKVTVDWDASGPVTQPYVVTAGEAARKEGRSDDLVWASTGG
ncbi:MAG: hypothetical protein ACJ74O_15635 [Frankiaceae bacterium]